MLFYPSGAVTVEDPSVLPEWLGVVVEPAVSGWVGVRGPRRPAAASPGGRARPRTTLRAAPHRCAVQPGALPVVEAKNQPHVFEEERREQFPGDWSAASHHRVVGLVRATGPGSAPFALGSR